MRTSTNALPVFVGDTRTDHALLALAHLLAEIAANISPSGITVSDSGANESTEKRSTSAAQAVAMPQWRRSGAGLPPIGTFHSATDEARTDMVPEEVRA
jgi:hypothetical protein